MKEYNYGTFNNPFAKKPSYTDDPIIISDDARIETHYYILRGELEHFCEVILYLGDEEIFIGKYNEKLFGRTDKNRFIVKYNDGKILVCLINASNEAEIIDVFSLYNIVDDTYLSCTAGEALHIFDPTMDASHLINKSKKIYRADAEKKKRIKEKETKRL